MNGAMNARDTRLGAVTLESIGEATESYERWLRHRTEPRCRSGFGGSSGILVEADILINKFNNAKGGGLVALLQTDSGGEGLFLLLIDSGNTDRLTLNTIDPNSGKIGRYR